jgi:hypothetical protein
MKFALIGAAAVAAAAFVTPALAQAVTSNPGYFAEFYPNANRLNWRPGNSYTDNRQNGMAMLAVNNNAYRYHGGPKYND